MVVVVPMVIVIPIIIVIIPVVVVTIIVTVIVVVYIGGVLPSWLGCGVAGAVILNGTAAILVGSTAVLAATLTARFGALAMVVMWLLHRASSSS